MAWKGMWRTTGVDMGVNFTPAQQSVINLHKKNLLVSAAAGSGKTAVLVERIIQMISDETNPVDIDRLLIVTYTNAAAAEMRERISEAITKKMESDPDNSHLQRQSTLIHNAQITTIDSFCLYLLRNHFDQLDIDPAFRPADEGEMKMLKQDVCDVLLEEKFVEASERFIRLVECLASTNGEKAIEDIIFHLHTYACSYPFPESWLESCRESYKISSREALLDTDWMKQLITDTKEQLEDLILEYETAILICQESDGPYMYGELVELEKEMLYSVSKAKDYEAMMVALETIHFDTLPRKKDDSVHPDKREQVKNIRNAIKKKITTFQNTYFSKQIEHILKDAEVISPLIEEIVDLTLEFMKRFQEAKKEKNVIDFSDMEHMALKILINQDEKGGFTTTAIAKEYQDHFEEIMIDEYQDANLVQEYLLSSIARNAQGCCNRFMVGDVKQSIYRFRLSKPELFMEKMDQYESVTPETEDTCTEDSVRIDLCQNFRSRKEVLDCCNHVFEKIMCKELGGVIYDEPARLNLGAAYEESDENYQAELMLVTGKEEEEENPKTEKFEKKECEARMVARKILDMVGHFKVQDKETKMLRPARFSDIVILFRTNTGWDDVFRKILEEYGIPVYVNSKSGYFSAVEVSTALQLLRVLDNPRQDIPLFAVLHSPMFEFNDEELAMIKAGYQGDSCLLYDCLCNLDDTVSEEVKKKTKHFWDFLTCYRKKASYVSVHVLLEEILRVTGYLEYVSALPAGMQRRANLEMLLQKATEFEKTSFQGLFRFVRFIEQLQEYEIDYGEALSFDEGADAVRIMSIHKSKGLEFPICFVSGLEKKHNLQDSSGQFLMDMNMGIAIDYWNEERRIKDKDLRKLVLSNRMTAESIGEELRVLYVAMTRAKEKLILTGACEDFEKTMEELERKHLTGEGHFSKVTLLGAKNCLDWILMCLAKDRSLFQVSVVSAKELTKEDRKETIEDTLLYESLVNRKPFAGCNKERKEEWKAVLSYEYPHKNLEKLFTKTTVSELKKAAAHDLEEDGASPLFAPTEPKKIIPKFLNTTEEISGTVRGTAYHRVMELLDFSKEYSKEEYQDAMNELIASKKITKEATEAVQYKKIQECLLSDTGQRMKEASRQGVIFKEQPFVYGLSAKRLDADFPKEETVLIQGIIDVFWEEADGIVILDYKTDALEKEEEFIKRYKVQLDYYKEALENITGKRVKEILIYSFKLGKAFSV